MRSGKPWRPLLWVLAIAVVAWLLSAGPFT